MWLIWIEMWSDGLGCRLRSGRRRNVRNVLSQRVQPTTITRTSSTTLMRREQCPPGFAVHILLPACDVMDAACLVVMPLFVWCFFRPWRRSRIMCNFLVHWLVDFRVLQWCIELFICSKSDGLFSLLLNIYCQNNECYGME